MVDNAKRPVSAQARFVAGPDGTRVTLTHGGWDALGKIAPILRRKYVSGWQNVLGTNYADFAQRGA